MNKHLVIRADANTSIGIGHLMRCIALAQAWHDRGGKVTFLSHCESDDLRQRIIDGGFDFIPIETPHPDTNDLGFTLDMLSVISHQPSATNLWLVLDSYHFTADYQKAIRENGYRLLAIDDMAHLDHYHADILLNQNIHASSLHYSCDRDTVKLLGCEYVLLRREFLKYKDWKREIPDKAKNILVTMGGADPDNVTLKVIKALNNLNDTDLEARILVGPSNANIESLKKELSLSVFNFQLLTSANNVTSFMVWADVTISAGGSTCWELAFMGLPFLTIILADNQEGIAEGLERAGVAINCDWFHNLKPDLISQHLLKVLPDATDRINMSIKGKNIIDGFGVDRVIEEMKVLE